MKLLSPALLYLATLSAAKNVVNLNFDIKEGEPTRKLVKRDGKTEEISLGNGYNEYLVTLKLGSSKQEVLVSIDTGSADLWVTEDNNPYCISATDTNLTASETSLDVSPTIDCSAYGTFNKSQSKTLHSNGTEFFISYGDRSFADGVWVTDDVELDNISLKDFSFGLANISNSTSGVLGIGLSTLETTNQGALVELGVEKAYTYDNFPIALVNAGYIHKNVYSLYLDKADSKKGELLFGGVDHAKYNGTLATVPMAITETEKKLGAKKPSRFEVLLTKVEVEDKDKKDTSVAADTVYTALLDSGTSLTYMPESEIEAIAKKLGAKYDNDLATYTVPCSHRSKYNILFDFQGQIIPVPLDSFLMETEHKNDTCQLGILSSSNLGQEVILGDTFLRYAYVVYDLEDYEISLASVVFTDKQDIEEIVSTVPSATKAQYYSSTEIPSSETSTGSETGSATSTATSSSDAKPKKNGSSSKSALGPFVMALALLAL